MVVLEEKLTKRTSSYYRLKEKLKRNTNEHVDREDWPRPNTAKEIVQHALKGAARAFVLAYGVRASVNFCLFLIRVLRKKAPLAQILNASFNNLDSIRFGAMFGSFALLWKTVNNTMRVHRQKDDRLNGLVAGSIAGLSILFETKERRADIAQQMLVRALQAIYNAGKARDIFYFKNGDALLFGITCAQVLYAYTMNPKSLPPDFYVFTKNTSKCPDGSVLLNEKNVRGLPVSVEEALEVIKKLRPTEHALSVTKQLATPLEIVPCEVLHPWVDGCTATFVDRFITVFKMLLPIYGTLHFVPMLLLRSKHFMRDPTTMLSKTAIATIRSGTFLSLFVSLYQWYICLHRQLYKTGAIGKFHSKYIYYAAGFLCAYPSIFIEDKKRRSELALYMLPKAIQSFYHIADSHSWIFRIKHFEVIMTSFAMGIIMSFYQEEADVLSAFVRKIMYQFFQKN